MPAPTSLPTASGSRISSIPQRKNFGSQSRWGLGGRADWVAHQNEIAEFGLLLKLRQQIAKDGGRPRAGPPRELVTVTFPDVGCPDAPGDRVADRAGAYRLVHQREIEMTRCCCGAGDVEWCER